MVHQTWDSNGCQVRRYAFILNISSQHHLQDLPPRRLEDISLSLEDMMKSNIINNNDYNHISQSDNRKQWAINAEDILNTLYLSYALLCYNPMALVICALKNTEPVVIIDRYLEYRHGATVSAELQEEAAKVDAFLNTAKVEEDQKTIKKYLKRLQTSAIWSSSSSSSV
jgi:tRNA A22 N-methylase